MKIFTIGLVTFLLLGTYSLWAKTITIKNSSGAPFYVYNFNNNAPAAVNPYTGGDPLASTDSLDVKLSTKAGMRIYFSKDRLKKSLEQGTAPNPFDYTYDAIVQYSFIEYSGINIPTNYTIDLSYIDEYSYPTTLTFSNTGTYGGCVEGHEYGISSMSSLKQALTLLSPPAKGTKYAWDALIWPNNVAPIWNKSSYPLDLVRVIGPNKVWAQIPGTTIPQGWVPNSYSAFVKSLPKSGNQLFGGTTPSTNNWTGWENWAYNHDPTPSDTGYVLALHSAATPDSNNKYGFFCYPTDNTDGGFQLLPNSVDCKVTVYSLTN